MNEPSFMSCTNAPFNSRIEQKVASINQACNPQTMQRQKAEGEPTDGSSRRAFAERMLSSRLLSWPPVLAPVNSPCNSSALSGILQTNPLSQAHSLQNKARYTYRLDVKVRCAKLYTPPKLFEASYAAQLAHICNMMICTIF